MRRMAMIGALWLASCGGTAGTPQECVPGATGPCVGPGGCIGAQACLEDGTGFGVCDCGGSLVGPDSGVPGGDAATWPRAGDGPTSDGGTVSTDSATVSEEEPFGNLLTCPDGCDDGNECTRDHCIDGECTFPLWDDQRCTEGEPGVGDPGTCHDGQCCTGCWDRGGGECRVGDELQACGWLGDDCQTCDDGNPCTDDSCELTGAVEHFGCVHDDRVGACPEGECRGGNCHACGDEGEQCCDSIQACGNGLTCNDSGRCEACGAPEQLCCNVLIEDQCREGGVCSEGICEGCGYEDGPCCATAEPCDSNLSCKAGTCSCGGVLEPCCGGTTCDFGNYCDRRRVCQDR